MTTATKKINATTSTVDLVDLYCETGLWPTSDYDDYIGENTASWFAERFDAITGTNYGYLVAGEYGERLTVAQITRNGVTIVEAYFQAPEGEVSSETATAFRAVVRAWTA